MSERESASRVNKIIPGLYQEKLPGKLGEISDETLRKLTKGGSPSFRRIIKQCVTEHNLRLNKPEDRLF